MVLGGNAVYETDESLSGSAYVVGGHLSHVSAERHWKGATRVISLSPLAFWGCWLIAFLLVSALIAPRVRRGVAVNSRCKPE